MLTRGRKPVSGRLMLVVLAAALILSAAVAPRAARATEFGVHQDLTYNGYPDQRAQAIANARDVLGARVSRSSFLWDKVEPAPGQFDWSVPDSVVSQLAAAGITPLFTVYGSPTWASGAPMGVPDSRMYVPADPAAFDRWLASYADFMRAAAARYRGSVSLWEVGNEENEHFFWKPGPNVDQYARFYTTLRAAILAGNPDAKVALGGLAGIGAGGDIPGLRFLQELNARGVYPDAVALHPYPSANHAPDQHLRWEDNFDDIDMVHRYLVSSGHAVPIWVTEWGWSSGAVGPDAQARYVTTSIQMIRERYPYVAYATYFVDHDQGEYDQGLFDAAWRPKPAAFAFARAIAPSPAAAAARSRAQVGKGQGHALLRISARGSARRLVVRVRGCAGCRVVLRLRHRGHSRNVRTRSHGSAAVATLRRLGSGRWWLSATARDAAGHKLSSPRLARRLR